MFAIFKDLMFNFLCILMMILLWRFLIDKNTEPKTSHRKIVLIVSAISTVMCISFPVTVNGHFVYDLRHIPIWIAGLYGGPVVSLLMFCITVAYRALFGGMGLYIAIFMTALQTVTTIYLSKPFLQWKTKKRITVGTLLSTGSAVIAILTVVFFYETSLNMINLWISYILAQTLCMFIVLYVMESFRESIFLHEKLIKMEKMEGLYHLAAAFGHEMRQPVTSCKGMLQLLKEDNWSSEKRDEFLNLTIAELNRAETLLEDYLTFAKPAPKKLESLNLAKEIQHVIHVIQPIANLHNVEIRYDLSTSHVVGEKTKVQQYLINIMKNAIEAMEQGGVLTIRLFSEGRQAVTEISDTGIGMSREHLRRLGEPFFSLKETKGTGLGLMVAFRIIEGMNGKIDIESELGQGTKVTIKLPLVEQTFSSEQSLSI